MAAVTPGYSPYHANYNNPVMFTDPLGLCPECPRDKRYYDARDNFMDYEPTSYVSPNLNGNSRVHSIGRNSRVYERYQMWSDARTLGLNEYAQKYGEAYTNMNAYWRYYEEEQMVNGVQVKRPELIISGHASSGYFPLERKYVRPDSPQPNGSQTDPLMDQLNSHLEKYHLGTLVGLEHSPTFHIDRDGKFTSTKNPGHTSFKGTLPGASDVYIHPSAFEGQFIIVFGDRA